jgi:hypothetical protein
VTKVAKVKLVLLERLVSLVLAGLPDLPVAQEPLVLKATLVRAVLLVSRAKLV